MNRSPGSPGAFDELALAIEQLISDQRRLALPEAAQERPDHPTGRRVADRKFPGSSARAAKPAGKAGRSTSPRMTPRLRSSGRRSG